MKLYSIAIPLVVASASAIPTIPIIPTFGNAAPVTSGIVATDDGTVYFVDSFNEMVWRVQPGGPLDAFVSGRNGRALCLDDDGHVYGTHEDESGNVVVWRANAGGAVVDLLHPDVPQYGHAMVVEDDGEMIASIGAGRRTGVRLVRTSEHEHQLIAGGEMGVRDGAGEEARFLPIGGMARAPDGDLLVTSGASIRRISSDGSVRTVAKDEELLKPRRSFLARLFGDARGHLTGIAVGDDGSIYVANSARNAVIRINADGSADEIVKAEGGWTPTGVAAANGSLYILEYGRGVRVRRFDANGTITTVAHVKPDRGTVAALPIGRFKMPATIG